MELIPAYPCLTVQEDQQAYNRTVSRARNKGLKQMIRRYPTSEALYPVPWQHGALPNNSAPWLPRLYGSILQKTIRDGNCCIHDQVVCVTIHDVLIESDMCPWTD